MENIDKIIKVNDQIGKVINEVIEINTELKVISYELAQINSTMQQLIRRGLPK